MVWMDQNPAVGKEGETVLLSLGNPAWRPGAVKHCVCVYSDMCFKSLLSSIVCVCVCVQ